VILLASAGIAPGCVDEHPVLRASSRLNRLLGATGIIALT
jgi:hypothetical protein